MFFVKDAYAVVWSVDKIEDRYARVRIGTSEKDQQGNYTNSNWFATFVGKARDKVETLKAKDRITVITGKISNVSKKQDDASYKTYLNVVVFDFEVRDFQGNQDSPPVVEESDEDEIPF